jgi:hypothetical protein
VTARFGIKVVSDNGHHVTLQLFAATGGEHLGGCGQLTMRADEYTAFRRLLAPALTDRSDPPPPAAPVNWSAYRKCDACFAELGEPCLVLSGYTANSGSGAVAVVAADRPHGGRVLRAGAVDRG